MPVRHKNRTINVHYCFLVNVVYAKSIISICRLDSNKTGAIMSTEKFKIWATIWWGYKYTFQNTGLLLRTGWLLITTLCLLFAALPYFIAFEVEYFEIAAIPIVAWAFTCFAVSWHRGILLNEQRPRAVRFGRPEFLYFAISLSIYLLTDLPDFLATTNIISQNQTITLFLLFALSILIFLIASFATAALPSIAIDDRAMSIIRAWKLWKGNRFRLILFLNFGAGIGMALVSATLAFSNFASRQLLDLFNINYKLNGTYEIDFFKFMLAYVITSPLIVISLFLLMASYIGALSISYAGIIRRGISVDKEYHPKKEIRDRVSV